MIFLEDFSKPVVVDVTLRDGGYLNNWMFSETNIQIATKTAQMLGADILEIGYVSDEDGLPVALTWNPKQITTILDLKESTKLAVMCRPSVKNPDYVVESRKDLIDFIRIPVDLRNTPLANKLAHICERNNMPYSFNLTGLSLYSTKEIVDALSTLSDAAAVVYLADSRGALLPQDVTKIINAIKDICKGRIGFHAHNSLGLAATNTLKAMELGCEFIDGSLFGIGLGGRNLDLLEALEMAKKHRTDLPEVLPLNGLNEESLGVPPNGDEKSVYYLAAERNIKMEWIALMIEQMGIIKTQWAIENVPRGNWFLPQEIEKFVEPTIWRKIIWS